MGKKKSTDQKIADALNINLSPDNKSIEKKTSKENTEIVMGEADKDRQEDYGLVRDNLKGIITNGKTAIDGILNIASEGESPRAYEVVSQLIKSVSDANKDLLDLHKKMKELDKEEKSKQSAGRITNNAIYVGSTKDLQKFIKEKSKEDSVIDAEFEVIEESDNEGTQNISR